jgi:drug/metabolite transporter (DMT)-like permease
LFRNLLLLSLVVIIWAATWPIVKIGVRDVPPIWFAFLRYFIATVLVFGVVAIALGVRWPSKADWPLVIVSGGLQGAAYAALMSFALVILPPGRASVLAYSTPIWVVPLAAYWLAERLSKINLVGVSLGILGVVTIASPALRLVQGDQRLAYLALVLASMSWAFNIVFIRRHRFLSSPFALAPWQMLVAAVLLLPVALLIEGPLPALSRTGILSLAFVGPVSTGFAYWAVVETGRYFRASTMSVALLATPPLGILISAVALGEVIDQTLVVGVLMVGLGIVLTSIVSRPRNG